MSAFVPKKKVTPRAPSAMPVAGGDVFVPSYVSGSKPKTVRPRATAKPIKPAAEPHDSRMIPTPQTEKPNPVHKAVLNPAASKAAAARQVSKEHGATPTIIAPAANTQTVKPIVKPSTTHRFVPHFEGEPIAGYKGVMIDSGTHKPIVPGQRPIGMPYVGEIPYYTDENTAKKNHGQDANEAALMFPDVEAAAQRAAKVGSPVLTGTVEALATALPGVISARQYAQEGHVSTGTAFGDVVNSALWLTGVGEVAALGKAGKVALRGGDVTQAFREARAAAKAAKVSKQEVAAFGRNVLSSESRRSYVQTLKEAGYSRKSRKALLEQHDRAAIAFAARNDVTPAQAWDRIYAGTQYHDVRATRETIGAHAFAQEGSAPEISNVGSTPATTNPIPDKNFLKNASRRLTRKHKAALPPEATTPARLEALLNELRMRAIDASEYKNWYSNSANAILHYTQGDVREADKLAALIAVYSPRAEVYSTKTEWNNLDRALNAYHDFYESGGTISPKWSISSHKTGEGDWQTFRAQQIMAGNFEWEGLKTNRFYRNFLQHIDPAKYEAQFGTEKFGTMDTWMRRAYKYPKQYKTERVDTLFGPGEVPVGKAQEPISPQMYAFMEDANKIVADSLGWSPDEAQAAIWTSIKAEAEGTSHAQAGFDFGDAFSHRAMREATKPTSIEQLTLQEKPAVYKMTAAEAEQATPDPRYVYHGTDAKGEAGIDASGYIRASATERNPYGGENVWLTTDPARAAFGAKTVYAIPRDSIPQDLLGKEMAFGTFSTSGDVHLAGNLARDTSRVQIANEAKPGDAPIFDAERAFWNSLSPGEQASYAEEIFKITRPGTFEKIVGLDSAGHHMGLGVWRGKTSVGTANHAIVKELTAKEIADLNAVAAAKGIVQSQDSVSWGRPLARGASEGEDIFPGFLWRPKVNTPEEMARVGQAIDDHFGAGWVGVINGPEGSYYLVDFSGADKFDHRLRALIGDEQRLEPISWQGGYVEDVAAQQEGAWGVTYQDAIASHPKAAELQAAIDEAKAKAAKIREGFVEFSGKRAQARYDEALVAVAQKMGVEIPKSGKLGKTAEADVLKHLSRELKANPSSEYASLADTLDEAAAALNSPDPEFFFQTDNPLLDAIAAAHNVPVKGAVERLPSGEHALHLFQGADISTAVHEFGHALETMIPQASRDALKAAGLGTEEQFARAFERYFYEGVAPTQESAKAMRTIATEMAKVYRSAEDIPNAVLSPEIRAQFDSFFRREGSADAAFAAREGAAWFAQEGENRSKISDVTDGLTPTYLSDGRPTTIGKVESALAGEGGQPFHLHATDAQGNLQGAMHGTVKEDGTMHLAGTYVLPEHRGQGISTALHDVARKYASDNGLTLSADFQNARLGEQQISKSLAEGRPVTQAPGGRWYFQNWNSYWPHDATNEAKALAEQHGIDPTKVIGTGVDGRVLVGDVERYVFEQMKPADQLRSLMAGLKIQRGKQEAGYSIERGARFQKAEQIYTDPSMAPEDRLIAGKGELAGELPKIVVNGHAREMTQDTLDTLLETVFNHPSLMTGHKTRVADALVKLVREGVVPTKSELKLMQHVWGRDTTAGLEEAAKNWKNLALSALNIPRSIESTLDVSFGLRQALVAATYNPKLWQKAYRQQFQYLSKLTGGGEKAYQALVQSITDSPNFPIYQDMKLAITDLEHEMGMREEGFQSNLAEMATIKGHGPGNVIRGSGRAYTGMALQIRTSLADRLLVDAAAAGQDIHDQQFLQELGHFINGITGRGRLPGRVLEESAPLLNSLFFSPRLLASRVQMLNPRNYIAGNKFVRRQYLKAGLRLYGSLMGVLGAVALFVPGAQVGMDWRSSDFGKIRVGDTRIDLGGGFNQLFHLMGMIVTGQKKSSTTGKVSSLTSNKFGQATRADAFIQFFTGKLAPTPSMISDWANNKNPQHLGQPFDWTDEAASKFLPLIIQDAWDLYNEPTAGLNGIEAAALGYGLAAQGVGVQTYKAPEKGEKQADTLAEKAKEAGMPGPTPALLLDVKHKAELDSLSQDHAGDPQGRLDAYLKYYAETTGDHQWDKWIGKKLSDDQAAAAAQNIRHALIGPGLSQYEAAIRAAQKAQGK